MSWDTQDAAYEWRYQNSIYSLCDWYTVPQVETRLERILGLSLACEFCGATDWDEFFHIVESEETICEDCCKTTHWDR